MTGQDGSYLARLLLSKGYEVVGGYHDPSEESLYRLKLLGIENHIELVQNDLLDVVGLKRIISRTQPTEVYNLAAQSFVHQSFEKPVHTGNVTGLGVHNLLEAIRDIKPDIRYYQASSSELFGHAGHFPQSEATPFKPRSPYGIAKLYAHWATINYRESYNLFAVAGILFNHESPLRGVDFVTRKITTSVTRINAGLQHQLEIGALDVRRDWGYAPEYVEGMWKMLQNEVPKDYVLSTGETHSVREWIESSFAYVGIPLIWEGGGINEQGLDGRTGQLLVKVNPIYYRPAEISALVGDSALAKQEINWKPSVKYQKLVEIMMEAEINRINNLSYV